MLKGKVLLVCEGCTDYPILEGIIKKVGVTRGVEFNVELLAPRRDATTGNFDDHGWTEVKRWCEFHADKKEEDLAALPPEIKAIVRRNNWRALLALSKADLLLIQIDTDIANEINPSFDPTRTHRKDVCSTAVKSWLCIDSFNDQCNCILPTYALETWILATYDNTTHPHIFTNEHSSYEDFVDFEDKLIAIGYRHKIKRGRRRLIKKYTLYKTNVHYLPRLLDNLEEAASRCSELQNLISITNTLCTS